MKMLLLLLSIISLVLVATAVTANIIQPKMSAPQLRIGEDKDRYPIDIIDENCLRLRTNITAITEKASLDKKPLTLEQSALLALNQLPLTIRGEITYKDFTKEIIFCHNMEVGEYKWGFNSTVIEITNTSLGVFNNTAGGQNHITLPSSNSSLVAYFPYNYQDVGDESQHNNDGIGTNLIRDENCFNGTGCYRFQNLTYATVEHSETLNQNQSFTMMLWANLTDIRGGQDQVLFTRNNLAAAFVVDEQGAGNQRVYGTLREGDNARILFTSTNLENNTWFHVAMSFNTKTLNQTVYKNGVLNNHQALATDGITLVNEDWYIGQNSDGTYPINGSIKNIRIYNRSLNDTEINFIYNNEAQEIQEPRLTSGTYIPPVENTTGIDDYAVVNNITYDCRETAGNNCSIQMRYRQINYSDLSPNLIAHYTLDGNIDASINSTYNGKIVNRVTYEESNLTELGQEVTMDGTDDNTRRVELTGLAERLNGSYSFTFGVWAKQKGDCENGQNALVAGSGGHSGFFALRDNGNTCGLYSQMYYNGTFSGSVAFSNIKQLEEDAWYFVVYNFNETEICVYINDDEKDCDSTNSGWWYHDPGSEITLGVDNDNRYYLNGSISEVFVCQPDCNRSSITALYDKTKYHYIDLPRNYSNPYYPPQLNATHAQTKLFLEGNGTTSTFINMNYSVSDEASFPATGPAVATGDLDLLFTNVTDTSVFKTVYQEGENFRFWWNWSYSTNSSPITNETGECNFTVDDVYIEDEGLVDFTLCDAGQGCTQDNPYLGEFELEYTNVTEQITEDLISIDICHTQQISAGLVMTVECTDHQQLFIVNKNEFARCSDGFSTVQRQPDICKNNTLINVTLQNTANTYPKSHNISDWDYDRRLAQHTDSYSDGEITFNFTRNLWFYEDSYEQYDHGTVELNVTCYSAVDTNLNQTTSEQITIVNRAPIITFLDVIIQETTYGLVEGVTLEYNKGQYNWTIAVEDDDLVLINYTIYNNSVQVLSNQSTGVLDFTTPDGLFRYLGVYNITVWANDTNFNRTEESITFISNDTTPPYAEILYPLDSSIVITQSFDINATAEDNRTEELDFFWVVNGTTNSTGVNENSTLNASNGYYNLTLFVFDGVQNGSHTIYFTVNNESTDFLPPNVTLNYPTDGLTIEGLGVDFNCSATDNSSLNSATLWGNWSGVYQANQTNTTTVANATYILSEPLLPQGNFVWNCVICDIYSNCASFGSNYTFTMGYPPFNITIEDYSMEWIRLNWT